MAKAIKAGKKQEGKREKNGERDISQKKRQKKEVWPATTTTSLTNGVEGVLNLEEGSKPKKTKVVIEDAIPIKIVVPDMEKMIANYREQFHTSRTDDIIAQSVLVEANGWTNEAIMDPVLHRVVKSSLPALENAVEELPRLSKNLSSRLVAPWKALNPIETPLQTALYAVMGQYKDILYTNEEQKDEDEIRRLIALHSMDHVVKTRSEIGHNSAVIRKFEEDKMEGELELRDQGFTRTKVLIVLPFKNDAYQLMHEIIKLSSCTQLDNLQRFEDEFSPDAEENTRKSKDYNHTFKGNIDDCFKIGIKLAQKQLKLYSSFYSSDIIIASPLGLQMIIGESGDKKRDFDYLSSIEVLILDKSDIFLMQNWDHLKHVMEHMNLLPVANHGTDFSRVRTYSLDCMAKYVRQTIIISHFNSPELNSMIAGTKNIQGKLKITKTITDGSICQVLVAVPQIFYRVPESSMENQPDKRFEYFVETILPILKIGHMEQSHTLVVIPSYFDFVRVKNYLADHNYSIASCSEYTSRPKIDRGRNEFKAGEVKFLLYTERHHFFRRSQVRSKHVVFYDLPLYAQFYSELINYIQEDGSCTALFSGFDKMKLERIVGTDRATRMIKGNKESYMFSI